MSARWTEGKEWTLRALWAKGERLEAISEALGVSRTAVIAKAQRMGLPNRREVTASDHSSKRGAEILCEALRAHWELAGHPTAKFRSELVARRSGSPIYGVRSNLVNGLPPEAAA